MTAMTQTDEGGQWGEHTSLAVILFPNCSAIKPYSTFVNCGPWGKWFFGRNMFQMPKAWAFFFKSSRIDGWPCQRASPVPICDE
jgi:hypothetical protein